MPWQVRTSEEGWLQGFITVMMFGEGWVQHEELERLPGVEHLPPTDLPACVL